MLLVHMLASMQFTMKLFCFPFYSRFHLHLENKREKSVKQIELTNGANKNDLADNLCNGDNFVFTHECKRTNKFVHMEIETSHTHSHMRRSIRIDYFQ